MRGLLDSTLRSAARRACKKLGIEAPQPLNVGLSQPPSEEFGDYSSTIAMAIGKSAGADARRVAEAVVDQIVDEADIIESVEVKGPGFINIFLKSRWWQETVRRIVSEQKAFWPQGAGGGKRIQVEFVSANPVGPLNVVNARAAAYGDSLASLLEAVGNQVQREYYINDAGNQVVLFGKSVASRYAKLCGREYPFPEAGYRGDYIADLARWLYERYGEELAGVDDGPVFERLVSESLSRMVQQQKRTLSEYGVEFDVWFSERRLRRVRALEEVLAILQGNGATYRRDGAVWFSAKQYGDERDRVLVKKDGEPTYLLADLAYHRNKFTRGFDILIDIWGPDHQGHIKSVKAGVEALGHEVSALKIIISGQVRLVRQGKVLSMSKRAGEFITMEDLLSEVGKDAARFFFLMRGPSAHLDFDLDLAKDQTPENPVYYVQYAHARISSIFRKAAERGVETRGLQDADLALLEGEETRIAKRLCRFGETIERAAARYEPHQLCYYLIDLASEFHRYYNQTRVLTDNPEVTRARLALSEAVRVVVAQGLAIIGVSAPESM